MPTAATGNRRLLIGTVERHLDGYTLTHLFRPPLPALDRVRRDRQLEEALSNGPDPLHLTVVFGISGTTAAFYADSARQLLDQNTPPS